MNRSKNSNEGKEAEEETVVPMVHNFIESEPSMLQPFSCSLDHELILHILEVIHGSSTYVEKEMQDKAMKYVNEIEEENMHTHPSIKKRRVAMKLRMDGFDSSICQSSWAETSDYPGGFYEYIVIEQKGKESGGCSERLIMDINFRSQFAVARPTVEYTELESTLPLVFVGSEEKVKKTVFIMCRAAQQSLRQNGLHVAPWRKLKYMQSKWLRPRHCPQIRVAAPDILAFGRRPGNNMAWFRSKPRVWPL